MGQNESNDTIAVKSFKSIDVDMTCVENLIISEEPQTGNDTLNSLFGEFIGERLTSKIVFDNVPLLLQQILWNLVDSMDVNKKNYVQNFDLSVEDGYQKIVHTQYTGNYKKAYIVRIPMDCILDTIQIRDDKDECVMMFQFERD